MKNTFSHQKTSQCKSNKAEEQPSAGPDGIAIAPHQNDTGLPDALKAGVESLSGLAMDDVRVHYNSSKPTALQALAYAQGTDIHLGPGQERHLPHEAWHVVQQQQGRVKATMQMKNLPVNDNAGLEDEADTMAGRMVQIKGEQRVNPAGRWPLSGSQPIAQLASKRKRLIPLKTVADDEFYDNNGALSATNVAGEDTGTDAERVMGPRTGLYLGSSPSTAIMQGTINWLDTNLATANNWIRGHLLNDWLGGSGKSNDNLAPMSHTTNQQWNRNFEQQMKAITERIYSFYNNNSGTDYFLLTGYVATASGNYAPAALQGVTIPDQFDGHYYYAAYDRTNGNVDYTPLTVNTAWNELDQTTKNTINALENSITTTTMQTH